MTGNARTVLVTGGGRGVGRAIALGFAARGAHVIINYFHSGEAAQATLAEIVAAGGSAELIRATVAKPDSVADMFAYVEQRHGGLDVLVNNAARGTFAPLGELADDDWQRVLDTNLHGARWCAQAALPLLARRGGAIVNVSSLGATHVIDNYAMVGVSKAALEALTRFQAAEYAAHGVRVNAVSSPQIDNRVLGLFPGSDAMAEAVVAATPFGRLTTEEDLARVVLFLASPDAGWVTGQTLVADGGLTLGRALLSAPRPAPSEAESAGPVPVTQDPIAVVGMGVVLPGAADPDELWTVLCGSTPVFTEPRRRFRLEDFRSDDRAAPDRTYARAMGVIDEAAPGEEDYATGWLRRALRQAHAGTGTRPGDRHGLFVGAWADGSQHLEETLVAAAVPASRHRLRHAVARPADHLAAAIARQASAGILPDGTPCLIVDTACSSSLYSIDLGVKALLDDEVDIAYCGGVSCFGPRYLVAFAKLGGLSPDTDVRAFDEHADGTVFSEGAGMIALKRLNRARADGDRVLAVLGGFGAAADGRGKAIYAPNATGQRLALDRARSVNGLDHAGLVIAHATGTPTGDSTELEALTTGTESEIVCVSNKSLVGHAGWAAGVVSVVHALLCLRHNVIPAQQRFTALPAALRSRGVRVPVQQLEFPREAARCRTIGVSSFGFGGTNAHLLLRDAPTDDTPDTTVSAPPASEDELVLITWSAHLPGDPGHGTVRDRLAAGQAPAERHSFGEPYPEPDFDQVRLSRKTVRSTDRCHLMALAVAARFHAENGPLWTGIEDRAGVIAAHTGPTRYSVESLLRVYSPNLHDPDSADWTRFTTELKERVPETTEDTLPGFMPNVIPARIANRFDLHGPTLTVDTGRDSGLAALYTAAGYLRRGELDLALVLGVHGNSDATAAALLEVTPGELAEGAFLLAVARQSTAAERNWPVLARLDPRLTHTPPATEPAPVPSYGGADALISVLRATTMGNHAVLHSAHPGPSVTVRPSAETVPDRATPGEEATQHPTAQAPEMPGHRTRRHRVVFRPAPARPCPGTVAALPRDCLVLVDSADLAAQLAGPARRAGALLVSSDRAAAAHATVIPTASEDCLSSLLDRLDGGPKHIRLFASPQSTSWPQPPSEPLLALQELLFLAVRAGLAELGDSGSLAVTLLDPLAGGVPHPHTALFTGMVKSLVWELTGCRAYALVTTATAIDDVLTEITTEFGHRRELPVIHLRHGTRYAERAEPLPHDHATPAGPVLTSDSVVVATGGARGVTAAVVTALARWHQPRLWLIGTTDFTTIPPEFLHTPGDRLRSRRAAFITEHRRDGTSVAALNRRFDRLLDAGEAWRTLEQLRTLCGPDRVGYLTCDVTDPTAVAAAARTIGERDSRIDLLVNGAGLHRANGVATKTLDEFRRLRAVKVHGYHNLRAAFTDPRPRRWCNFGSFVGVFGLPGEIDYAPANEMLSLAARHNPATEYTIGWTIWAETGMGARGVIDSYVHRRQHTSLISNAEGVDHFLTELDRDRTPDDAVITLVGDRERATLTTQYPGLPFTPPTPYLSDPEERDENHARWQLVLDARHDPVLHDHLVEGIPTLPGTFALEIAAEAARYLHPGSSPSAFRNAHFDAFIRAPHGKPRTYQVTATRTGDTTVSVHIASDITANGRVLRTGRPHFEVEVDLERSPEPARARLPRGHSQPISDPYLAPDAPTRFSGMFRSTAAPHRHADGATARWETGADPLPDRLRHATIPALLLDALLRTTSFPRTGQHTGVEVPRRIRHIRLYTAGNDTSLADRHAGEITLTATESGAATAIDPDGHVLVEIDGVDSTTLPAITPPHPHPAAVVVT